MEKDVHSSPPRSPTEDDRQSLAPKESLTSTNALPDAPPEKRKKRVTIHSETTIMIVPARVTVTEDAPYYSRGCRSNVQFVAYFDFAISFIEIILCVVAVSYAIIISGEAQALSDDGSYNGKQLRQGIVALGFILIFYYFGEMWAVRKLFLAATIPGMDRRRVIHTARFWRCMNFLLITFELFFGISCCIGDTRTLAGTGVFIGGAFRVLGVCVIHQFIQELETKTVTPMITENGEEIHQGPVHTNLKSNTEKEKPSTLRSDLKMPQEPQEFLEKLNSQKT